MVSQHRLESFFHEIKCNGMASFMELMSRESEGTKAQCGALGNWESGVMGLDRAIFCLNSDTVTDAGLRSST